MSTQKLEDIVLMRVLAVVLMVLFHAYGLYLFVLDTPLKETYTFIFRTVLSGFLPLYTFISGYLFSYLLNRRGKYQEFMPFLKSKLHRLIVPYIVFALFYFLIFRDMTFRQFLYGHDYHLWFLLMLLHCFIVTHLLHKVKSIYAQLGILILAVALRTLPSPDLPFGLIYFKRFFLWFYFGYLVLYHQDKLLKFQKLAWVGLGLAGWIGSCWLFQYAFDKLLQTSQAIYFYAYVWFYTSVSLFFVLFCWTFANYLLNEQIFRPQRWLTELDKYSYGIYIFHPLFMFLITKPLISPLHNACMQLALDHPVIFPLVLFGYSFVFSMFMTKFVLKTRVGKYLIG